MEIRGNHKGVVRWTTDVHQPAVRRRHSCPFSSDIGISCCFPQHWGSFVSVSLLSALTLRENYASPTAKLKIIFRSLFAFASLPFLRHFMVLCAALFPFSLQVEEAIETKTLPAYLEKSNLQIADLVQLVRTDLQTGVRIAVEALIVLDVHGRWGQCYT